MKDYDRISIGLVATAVGLMIMGCGLGVQSAVKCVQSGGNLDTNLPSILVIGGGLLSLAGILIIRHKKRELNE